MPSTPTYPHGTVVLLVGTKRGLFRLTSRDRASWEVAQLGLEPRRVYNAVLDQRSSPRIFAADNDDFFGSYIRYSDDFGETWKEPRQGIKFPEDSGLTLKNIWIVEPGRADDPQTLYAGVDPASLWVSTDGGDTWDADPGLLNHPTREHWNPGNGGLCLHTIVPDPTNRSRMWVGISAVGCMRTDDGGQTWTHHNQHVRADFQPDKYPEYGQCLHRMVQHSTQPNILYQQNHCGIYKSTNAGDDWTDIRGSLPADFGFPMALDPNNPETVYTVIETDGRNNFGDQFTIYRTNDGGDSWHTLTSGLPGGPGVRLGVLRHGMCTDALDPVGVYVGTNTGQLFASRDRGDSWELIADFLPSIYSVSAAIVQ
ncbi:MAG TPA: hypothetical protein VIC85_02695 [Ktedonobacterales bacterium]|jgi:hypothetical protein